MRTLRLLKRLKGIANTLADPLADLKRLARSFARAPLLALVSQPDKLRAAVRDLLALEEAGRAARPQSITPRAPKPHKRQ